jgi:pSer/pThr/pTyr-binding forkhead associated (FHA) protein
VSHGRPTLIIRCAGRKPVRVHPGERLRIGRHASNDLVLSDDTVSRFHALIQWDPDEDRPFVQDNGSANGIEVDGDLIELKCHLPGGNQVAIGRFTLSCEVTNVDEKRYVASVTDSRSPDTPAATLEGSDSVVLFSEKKVDIQGETCSQAELQRLFLDLEEQQRTGTLSVKTGELKGRVTFCVGQVMSAQIADSTGRDALREILHVHQAAYFFSRELRPVEDPLKLSIRRYIMTELADMTKKLKAPARTQPKLFDEPLPEGTVRLEE